MNFGFRYHLASLMAVFFSLILGILIGGALFPDNALVEEQGVLITELEERFREFHAREQVLQAELEYSNKAWSELRDVMVPQRLQARTAVLIGQAEQEGTSMLEQVLHLAGAEVKTLKGEDLTQVIPTDDLVFIMPLTGKEIEREMLDSLQALALAGANLAFVWGSQDNPVTNSLPPGLLIDHGDTAIGEIALILGLSLGQKGHYGRNAGSVGLFPKEVPSASSGLDSGL